MVGYYTNNIHSTLIAAEDKGNFCTDPLNCFIFVFTWGFYHGDGIGGRKINIL
jgi:hypothetical protein